MRTKELQQTELIEGKVTAGDAVVERPAHERDCGSTSGEASWPRAINHRRCYRMSICCGGGLAAGATDMIPRPYRDGSAKIDVPVTDWLSRAGDRIPTLVAAEVRPARSLFRASDGLHYVGAGTRCPAVHD